MRTQLRTRQTARVGNQGSRRAILQAAITEFSREGVAGARTDAIARAAKVNKALLYYYFEDKESLYGHATRYSPTTKLISTTSLRTPNTRDWCRRR